MTNTYDAKFYNDLRAGSRKSAEIVLPILFDEISPRSIVDIGCGTGAWLSVAKEKGVPDVLGLDGDYARGSLQIGPDQFRAADVSKGFVLDRKYDIAMCLEVGEHVRTEDSPLLVESLTKAADVVLFSAGIPGQGGTHHINEQWPEFWECLFRTRNFVRIDCIRPLIYGNSAIEWWYRQNILLYVKLEALHRFPRLEALQDRASDIVFVHRSLLERRYGFVRSLLSLLKDPLSTALSRLGLGR